MQQHTGQHVLSAAFDRLHGARTESFHLGTEVSTIDLGRDVGVTEIDRAEDLANEVTWEDRPVGIRFVSDEEAARLPFRKPPAKTGRIRVIEVEGFDMSACGGTHVSRTGEVGLIAVRGWERYKGGTPNRVRVRRARARGVPQLPRRRHGRDPLLVRVPPRVA